jgi:hypothetical protein
VGSGGFASRVPSRRAAAAHLAKVERQIADQAALRTIAGGGVTEGGRVATALCLFTLR